MIAAIALLVRPVWTHERAARYSAGTVLLPVAGSRRSGVMDLDAAGRLAVRKAQPQATDGAWTTNSTTTSYYGCGCDSPTWTKMGDSVSHNVKDLTGGLAATTSASGDTVLQLADIHGDVTVQQPVDSTVASTVQHYDEYGNALAATASTRYGWLGTNQRSAETLSGYTLMGVRVHKPATGRFLQSDPILRGSPNNYGYPVDPVGMFDLNGQWWSWRKIWRCSYSPAWLVGSSYFAWVRLKAIWRVIRMLGGISATARYILSPSQKKHRLARLAKVLVTYSAAAAGIDQAYSNCVK